MVDLRAKLISVTQPVEDFPAKDAEGVVAHCARVSSPKPYESRSEDAEGLIAYCVRNKHWSVFDMVDATIEIHAPRDISRQLLRHSSFRFQEFSQRYSSEIEFTNRHIRKQDKSNRQNSIEDTSLPHKSWSLLVDYITYWTQVTYRDWIRKGVAKECARVILPEGLTMSHLYMKGSLRSWIHYLEVREDEGVTQKEHVQLARLIRVELEKAFGNTLKLVEN